MSESNNNIPMRITQLPEATSYTDGMYYAVASATGGTEKISTSVIQNDFNSKIYKNECDINSSLDTEYNISVDDLPTFRVGGYYGNDGAWNPNPEYYVKALKITRDYDKVYFSLDENASIDLKGCVLLNDGTYAPFSISNYGDASDNPYLFDDKFFGGYFLINRKATTGYKTAHITRFNYQSDYKLLYGNILKANAYQNNSLGDLTVIKKYRAAKITVKPNTNYFVNNSYSASPIGYAYDSNNQYISALTTSKNRINLPIGTAYFVINLRYDDYIFEKKEYTFCDVISKPYDFKNVNSIWFGDSITQNVYTLENGTAQYNENLVYRRFFADGVEMAYCGNFAQGGTSFAFGYTSVSGNPQGSIVYAIENKTIGSNIPYIFISGGTNDFGYGVPLGTIDSTDNTTFNGALNELSTHLNTNYSDRKIIILSPINRVDRTGNEVNDLDDYRQALFLWAVKNGYDFVNMSDSGFPMFAMSFYKKLFGDGLHPTLNGHAMMAKALRAKLC